MRNAVLLTFALLTGCSTPQYAASVPRGIPSSPAPRATPRRVDGGAVERIGLEKARELPQGKIMLRSDGPLSEVARALAEAKISIVYGAEFGDAPIRGAWVDVPVADVLESIAAQLSPEGVVMPVGSTAWYVGPPRDADQQTAVLRVPYGDPESWQRVYGAVASPAARIEAVDDLLVLRDVPAGIERIVKLHELVASPRRQLVADVVVAEVSQSSARRLGIDWSLNGNLTATLGTAGATATDAGVQIAANLVAEETAGRASVQVSQRLAVVDGGTAKYQVGDTIRLPRRGISSEGTVTTLGYDEISTGVLLFVSARSAASGSLIVNVAPELSSVTGSDDGVPRVSERSWESSAVVWPGQWLVLGGLADDRAERQSGGVPLLSLLRTRARSSDSRRLYLLVRVSYSGDEPDWKANGEDEKDGLPEVLGHEGLPPRGDAGQAEGEAGAGQGGQDGQRGPDGS